MKRRRADGRPFNTVLKVGGSLASAPRRLARLLRAIAALARRQPILVLPGGGIYADLVRSEMRRWTIPEAGAHRMALLAMDQYGLLLAHLCPGSRPVRNLSAAKRVAASGRTPILLTSALVERSRGLEPSFRLTSDSIAAWLARRSGARRLILLKSVPELPGVPLDRRLAERLAGRGIVDPLFPRSLPPGVEVRVIDGRQPHALRAEAQRGAASRPARVKRAARHGGAPAGGGRADRSAPRGRRRRGPR